MISERQKLVLMAIVEEYVASNEPVGSLTLSKRPELNFSTATLRNEMAELENHGYLEKTHVSSGRIPSEKGYRMYVEEIMKKRNNDEATFPMIDEIFERPNITKDEAIYESMTLVSELTNYASIMLGKTASTSRIKKLEFISLKNQYAVILMVTDQGHVESKKILIPDGINVKDIKKVVNVLDQILHNAYVGDIKNVMLTEIDNDDIRDYIKYQEELVDVFVTAFSDMATDRYRTTGRYNILSQPEFKDVSKVKELFNVFENRDILKVINSDANSIKIKIGQENELQVMQDCTVITVPYEAGDGSVGTIAIFGPTRMQYGKVIPLLEYIAQNVKKIT